MGDDLPSKLYIGLGIERISEMDGRIVVMSAKQDREEALTDSLEQAEESKIDPNWIYVIDMMDLKTERGRFGQWLAERDIVGLESKELMRVFAEGIKDVLKRLWRPKSEDEELQEESEPTPNGT